MNAQGKNDTTPACHNKQDTRYNLLRFTKATNKINRDHNTRFKN